MYVLRNKIIKKVWLVSSLVFLVACSQTESQVGALGFKALSLSEMKQITGDSWLDFSLKGVSYRLPVMFQELYANGWEATTSLDERIEPNTYIGNIFLRNDDNIIKVVFYNNTAENKRLDEVMVVEVAAENRRWQQDVPVEIVVYDKLNFESSQEDIGALLGSMTSESVSNVFKTEEYAYSRDNSVTFQYDISSGGIRWIIIKNFRG